MHKGLKAPIAGPALRGKHDPPDARLCPPCAARHTRGRNLFFTRVRDKPIQSAGIAVNPQKTSGQYAAIQECAQLLFHKARHHPVSLTLSGEEGLQMASNHIIKNRLFGFPGYILPHAFTNDEIRFGRHDCALAGWEFLQEICDRIWADHSHESASCDWKAANLSNKPTSDLSEYFSAAMPMAIQRLAEVTPARHY